MKRALLLFGLLFPILIAQAQTKLEQIFDPRYMDDDGKTLGQPGYSDISSLKSRDVIYFTAFSENSGPGIWRTNLNETISIKDFPLGYKPYLRLIHNDWLIYTLTIYNNEECSTYAINLKTLEEIELPIELDCIPFPVWDKAKYTGKYLANTLGSNLVCLNLDLLPAASPFVLPVSQTLDEVSVVINKHQILVKHVAPFSSDENYYLIDLDARNTINFSSRSPVKLSSVSRFYKSGSKYYFQTTPVQYGSRVLLECADNFSAGSFRQVINTRGNLIYVDGNIGYVAAFDGQNNTLDEYNLLTGNMISRVVSDLNWEYSNWSDMVQVDENSYIISIDGSYAVYYFDKLQDTLIALKSDIPEEFASAILVLESGLFIRFRNNYITEKLYYFPYTDLQPREILNTFVNGPSETHIFHKLPGNRVFAIVNDPVAGAEYAVIDAVDDSYNLLKDIHTTPAGVKAVVNTAIVMPDQRLILGIKNDRGNEVFVFDPITRKAVPISTYSNDNESVYLFDVMNYNGIIYNDGYLIQNYTSNDSVFYFTATQSNILQSYLFAFLMKENKLVKVCTSNYGDRLMMVDNHLFAVRTYDTFYSPINRELHYFNGASFDKLFTTTMNQSFGFAYIEQYFTHKGKLYFSSDEKLYSLDVSTREITMLIDNFAMTPKNEPVIFEHFMVINDEVYIAETRKRPDYFIHFFFGFNKDEEQTLWKTDGTLSGTEKIVYTDFRSTSFYNANTAIFSQGEDIYMSAPMNNDEYFRLYRLKGNQWEATNFKMDDRIIDKSPSFITQKLYSDSPEKGYAQNVSGYDSSISVLIGYSNPSEFYLGNEVSTYAFKNGIIPEIIQLDLNIPQDNFSFYSFYASPLQIADKLYFFSVDSTAKPSLKELSIKDFEVTEIMPDTILDGGINYLAVADKRGNIGYVVLGEVDYSGTLWSFKVNKTTDSGGIINQPIEAIIFPNPASSLINIELPEYNGEIQYSLLNLAGQLLRSGLITDKNTLLGTSNLSSGLYILLLSDGQNTASYKLVIAR